MVLADVGLGDLLWTALWVFMLVLIIWVFIAIVSDLFRDHEVSGWAKAAWVVALIVFPLVGSLAYLIVRGRVWPSARWLSSGSPGTSSTATSAPPRPRVVRDRWTTLHGFPTCGAAA
jgi:hypothetical protein